MEQYLLGSNGQAGALDLFRQSSEASANIQNAANSSQRASDIADVARLGPQANAAFRAANPDARFQLIADEDADFTEANLDLAVRLVEGPGDLEGVLHGGVRPALA
jgi:hypothetical protein